jgi:hypothetical protein
LLTWPCLTLRRMRQARATSKISDSRRHGSYQLQHAYNAACESRDGERIAYLLQSAPANAVDALFVFLDLLECEPERVGERPLSHPQMHASGAYLLPDMHVYRIWRLAPGRHDGHDFGTPRLRSLVAQKRYWKPQGFEDQLWGVFAPRTVEARAGTSGCAPVPANGQASPVARPPA